MVATIGAVLPGDFKIKKSKLRGVVSCGMNCSARELGIGSDHDGIMILPEDAPIGMPLADYLNLSDTCLLYTSYDKVASCSYLAGKCLSASKQAHSANLRSY